MPFPRHSAYNFRTNCIRKFYRAPGGFIMTRRGRFALQVALACASTAAFANGYQDLHQSAQGLGTAYAVNGAGITDISAMFSNPASLARFPGSWSSTGTSLILPRNSFENLSGTAPFTGTPLTGIPTVPKQFLDTTVGSAAYVSRQLTEDVFLGLAFTVPWATKSNYPDGAVSRYTAVDTTLRAYSVNPVIAYRINNAFSIGGGPNLQYYTSDFSVMVDATGGAAPAFGTDLKSTIKGSDLGFGFTLGGEYQITPATRIGLSYRSAVVHEFDGKMKLTSDNAGAFGLFATNVFNATGVTLSGPTANVTYKINTPGIASLGVSHKLDDQWEVYGNASLIQWSRFKSTRIIYDNGLPDTVVDNNWNDSWYLAVGAGYQITPELQLRTGIAYDWTPTPVSVRNPRAPNGDRVYVGAGFTYQVNEALKLDFAYGHCFFEDAPIALGGGNNTPRGTLNGVSKIDADIVMAQATVNLGKLNQLFK